MTNSLGLNILINRRNVVSVMHVGLCTSALISVTLSLLPTPSFAQEATNSASANTPESGEIIVTAQKREERLRDVPVPVTAVTASALLAQNQTTAQDIFSNIPGVNLQFQNNRAQLAIRGITTGPVTGNPVVGYTVDDVPYGSSTGQHGLYGSAPDLDPSELARIEVLRGPQGTLYGASSIGGLVKYVTVDPEFDKIGGVVAVGTNVIRGSGQDLGYNFRGAINVPLGETFAIRASAFRRHDAGFIDNVRSGKENVNANTVTGGRLSAFWRPSDTLSVKLGALYQERDLFGSSNEDRRLGSGYLQDDQIGSGRSNSKQQQYSAVINADLGRVKFTSVTGYAYSKNYDLVDSTASGITQFLFPLVYPEAPDFGNILRKGYSLKKFSQEARFSGSIGERVDWIVGGFYTREKAEYTLHAYAINPDNGAVYGIPVIWLDDLVFKEIAAFGNVTARITDQFDIQFGARYSENDQDFIHREWITFEPHGTLMFDSNTAKAKGHSFTYQVTPRFKLSPDHMFYARLATGYRPGGTNASCNPDPLQSVPCQFLPDEVVNFELGAKGNLLGRALSYDLSLFNIDWKKIQINQTNGSFDFLTNAGKARSRGVELALDARPARGLTLSLWGSYTDATLRESFATPLIYTAKGDRLPFSSRYSGRFSFNYEAPLSDEATGNIGASVTYVGDRKGEFVQSQATAPLRQTYPAYAQVGLNAGVKWDDWKINMFVQNLMNERGVTGGGYLNQTSSNPNWFYYTRPRTIGLSVERKF